MICQAIAGSALVLLSGVLAPDLKDRKKADKGGQHPCDLPKGRTKRRVGVWIWRNPVFRNKNTFKKRERERRDLAYTSNKHIKAPRRGGKELNVKK